MLTGISWKKYGSLKCSLQSGVRIEAGGGKYHSSTIVNWHCTSFCRESFSWKGRWNVHILPLRGTQIFFIKIFSPRIAALCIVGRYCCCPCLRCFYWSWRSGYDRTDLVGTVGWSSPSVPGPLPPECWTPSCILWGVNAFYPRRSQHASNFCVQGFKNLRRRLCTLYLGRWTVYF